MLNGRVIICAVVSIGLWSSSIAQPTLPKYERIAAQPLTGDLVFDGMLHESFWTKLEKIPLIMHSPNFGNQPSERSDVYLVYDDEYLYFAGRLYVSHSEFIRGTTYKRDAFDGTTDYFGLLIDSYNDKENALGFFTTPTGLRWDGTVERDGQSDEPVSINWNTYWDVKTKVESDHWDVEMRIPWTSLQFQDENGVVVMGITNWRFIAAKTELDIHPAVSPDFGQWSIWKPSQMREYRFDNVYSRKPLYVTPYALAGFQQSSELNDSESAYDVHKDPVIDLGLDVKYGLTSNLTLDVTINTDFAQVEADDEQINLTQFSLFLPEKRQFFQERASIFDFSFNFINRLFYSRQIGIHDEEPVRILGGVRVVGRMGNVDVGLLNMQTEGNAGLPSENFGVIRLRKQVLNENSYVGSIVTNRVDFEGGYNTVYGLDTRLKIWDDNYLTMKWAQSFTDTISSNAHSLAPSRWFLNWRKDRFKGFNYGFTLASAGQDYLPAMGFEIKEDYTSFSGRLSYGWLPQEQSKFQQLEIKSGWFGHFEHAEQHLGLSEFWANASMVAKSAWNANLSWNQKYEVLVEPLELTDDVEVPIGSYHQTILSGRLETPFTRLLGTSIFVRVGELFDGRLFSVDISPRWNVSPKFEMGATYQWNDISFASRSELLQTHIFRVRSLYTLSTKLSAAAFVQLNSLDKQWTGNFRIRYNPREGNDLYVVINGLLNYDREREYPILPRSETQVIAAKYTHTFEL